MATGEDYVEAIEQLNAMSARLRRLARRNVWIGVALMAAAIGNLMLAVFHAMRLFCS